MKRLAGIVLLLGVFACEEEEVNKLLLVDSKIKIEVTEAILENKAQFLLLLSTQEEYPCINYSLIIEEDVKSTSFSIAPLGVKPPEGICFTALGPATGSVKLGDLQNGQYELVIKVNSFTNKGTLEISADEISLDFPQQNGISIPNPKVPR